MRRAALLLLAAAACAADPPPPAPRAPTPVSVAPCEAAAPPDASVTFDPAPWIDDFRELTIELASHYANLESARDDRRMDLPALRRATLAELAASKTDEAAKRAIASFLRAFGDGHLSIASASHDAPRGPDVRPLCQRLRYGEPRVNPGVDFKRLPGFVADPGPDADDFPGGVLRLASGVKLGVVRIGLFMAESHPSLCEAARATLGLGDHDACDDACGFKVELEVSNRLLASLDRRFAALQKEGAAGIVLDVTGNGGGSDWVDPAAREATSLPLRAPRIAFPRHPHWTDNLKSELKDVEADIAEVHDARAPTLALAARSLRAAIAEAERPCDMSPVWEAGPGPTCSMLVRPDLYASGVLAYARDGAFEGLHSEEILFNAGQYRYREGANTLPLVVLVDGNTASAAELFVAMLKDGGAAVVTGSPTVGAGCGYTNGGVPAVLHHSGLRVKIPDCVRLRSDGANEVMGITPDVLLPFTDHDSPSQRAAKTGDGLERAWRARAGRGRAP